MNIKSKLVLRKCACGCGQTWRCLPTSTGEYFSDLHSQSRTAPFDAHAHSRISELFYEGLTILQIRDVLADEGYTMPRGKLFTSGQVYMIMCRLGLKRSRVGK